MTNLIKIRRFVSLQEIDIRYLVKVNQEIR